VVKAGIKNVCVHKGLFAPGVEKQFPNLRGFADVADVGQAAKDWPNLNFIIYHSAYRHVGGDPAVALAEFNRTQHARAPPLTAVHFALHQPVSTLLKVTPDLRTSAVITRTVRTADRLVVAPDVRFGVISGKARVR
jgi:predicted TIM-barrel fold metal-dependent hydrolase